MDDVFNRKSSTMEEDCIEVDILELGSVPTPASSSVNLEQYLTQYKQELTILVNGDKYRKLMVEGKAIKQSFREKCKARGVRHAKVMGFRICMFPREVDDFSYIKFNACAMLSYYNNILREELTYEMLAEQEGIVIPSLGVKIPIDCYGENKLMCCLAGPGCQYLLKVFLEKDVKGEDSRVGTMIAICLLLDWMKYVKETKDTVSFGDYVGNDSYNKSKETFSAAVGNIGVSALRKLKPEQMLGLKVAVNCKAIVLQRPRARLGVNNYELLKLVLDLRRRRRN